MKKKVLALCADNTALSIVAEAVLSRYLADIEMLSAGLKASKPLNANIKKALTKESLWSQTLHTKALSDIDERHFNLVIIMSPKASKLAKEFSDESTVIEIEYEEPNYTNSTELARFIKTIKMELIPITRDILEL